jgi:hypothetical protein
MEGKMGGDKLGKWKGIIEYWSKIILQHQINVKGNNYVINLLL